MKVRPLFAWYDFWVGVFWDRQKRRLYILPFPMVGIMVELEVKNERRNQASA